MKDDERWRERRRRRRRRGRGIEKQREVVGVIFGGGRG